MLKTICSDLKTELLYLGNFYIYQQDKKYFNFFFFVAIVICLEEICLEIEIEIEICLEEILPKKNMTCQVRK